MLRIIKGLGALAIGLGLAACGGGGSDAGAPPFGGGSGGGGGTGPTPATVDVVASSTELGTGGETITITAIVKAAGNVSLPGAVVSFTTDTGTLTAVSAVTDSAGVATATLSAGSDKSNRTAHVTATSGGVVGAIDVKIAGTTIDLTGVTTLSLGATSPLSVKVADSRGNAIAGVSVAIASSLGNGLSAATVTTDGQGNALLTYTASQSGSDKITITGAGATDGMTITISGEDFKFLSPSANQQVPVSTPSASSFQTLVVQYLKNGVAQAGVTVNFAATAGQLSATSVSTDGTGKATVTISSTSAAAATVQASLVGASVASATLPIQFVATTPSALVLQVSPTAIGPNTSGSTAKQAQVQARVTDANGNPVANKTVNFSRDVDPSGGNLSQPSAITDLNGVATVQYIAGPQSTANNGVQLRATVAGTAVFGTASLSVNQTALFIALGTGNVISNLDPQTYKKDWVVYVTDSNGIAVPGVTLTIRVLPTRYRKGVLAFDSVAKAWVFGAVSPMCASEDGNQNGVLDAGEDVNGNGTLQPGNVISVTPGTVQTDASGRTTVSLIYAESYVPWVEVQLSVTAIVSGTESTASTVFTVQGLSSDFSDANVAPAGETSPFGKALSCNDPL